ncbi:bacteriocin [Paraclostridium sordellii]|uniref:bacteriocin n=1 Tax=Paraclostridium sordellii TaxID=1505 RepID=UPI000E4DC2E8|nr:bacteriocin [Paeniclostridium sordellii]RGX03148.1 bacteriocin [Paeniclostridium sordellii]
MKELNVNEMSKINGGGWGPGDVAKKIAWGPAIWGAYEIANEWNDLKNDIASIPSKFRAGFKKGRR